MQNNSKGNHFSERNLSRLQRRTSTSGFEYPEDLVHIPSTFRTIPESKYPSMLENNIMNGGDHQKKSEITSQNFFSENTVNFMNRNQVGNMTNNTFDPRYYYNDSSSISRLGSTPFIAQSSAEYSRYSNNYNDVKVEYNQPFQSLQTYTSDIFNNRQNTSNSQIYTNGNSYPYSQYVLYDLRTNSYQNVVFYSPNTTVINSDQNINEDNVMYCNSFRSEPQTCEYQTLVNLTSDKPYKENYLDCQMNMTQQSLETEIFPEFVKDDLMYFLPPDLPNEISDSNRAESQSMPSLHGDDSTESDFETSDDDQLNTVHGEEMLQELQKLSSVFTNVVNLPLSRNNDTMCSADFASHSNLSRFKKTRIKERTTFWRMQRFLVKDNMVKIIPDKVLNIVPMDVERIIKSEIEMFGCQFEKQDKSHQVLSDPPDCIHSSYRCRSTPIEVRYLKHSSRSNQKYRPSFNAPSPIDLNQSINQQMPPNISSRHSHRKSLQIPIRIPVVWNPIIPVLSPAVPHRSRMFFEQSSNNSVKNSRRKRRWSVSGTKFEKNCGSLSSRPHILRHAGDIIYPLKYDVANEHFDNYHSFDFQEQEECSHDRNSHICSILESKLDKQLNALKRTVMSYVECNMTEIKDEIQCLKSTQTNLEKKLQYYQEKVHILEESIRHNLPHEQWNLYGIKDNVSNEQ